MKLSSYLKAGSRLERQGASPNEPAPLMAKCGSETNATIIQLSLEIQLQQLHEKEKKIEPSLRRF